MHEPVLMDERSVCSRYGVSVSTLYRRVKSGDFPPPVALWGSAKKWRIADLLAWEASLQPKVSGGSNY